MIVSSGNNNKNKEFRRWTINVKWVLLMHTRILLLPLLNAVKTWRWSAYLSVYESLQDQKPKIKCSKHPFNSIRLYFSLSYQTWELSSVVRLWTSIKLLHVHHLLLWWVVRERSVVSYRHSVSYTSPRGGVSVTVMIIYCLF